MDTWVDALLIGDEGVSKRTLARLAILSSGQEPNKRALIEGRNEKKGSTLAPP